MAPLTKLMPLYDQSESWLEFSGKILSKLNEVIREVNAYFEIDLDTYVVNLLRPWASADITVDSLDEGSEPTASITQDHNGTHLFLGLPKGDTGLSSYDYAVLNGYTGTLEDFTNDILGYTGAYAAQLAAESARDEIVSSNLNHEKYLNWRRITTNPASFYPVPQSPLYVRASGEPIQSGTGDPSPDNIRPILPWKAEGETVKVQRTGKNLVNSALESGSIRSFETGGGLYDYSKAGRTSEYIRITGGKTYTVSIASKYKLITFFYYDSSQIMISSSTQYLNKNSGILTPTADVCYVKFTFWIDDIKNVTVFTDECLQLELGSTATPYEPYSGEEITLTAPQDIYGGWVDNEGKGSSEWKTLVFNGVEDWFIPTAFPFFRLLPSNFSYAKSNVNSTQYSRCSHFRAGGFSANLGHIIAGINVNTGKTVNYVCDSLFPPTPEGLADWKAYLASQLAAGTPVTLSYLLRDNLPLTPPPAPLLALPQADRITPRLNVVATDAPTLQTDYAKSPIEEANT